MTQAGRNALCPCGSGRKYKHCCIGVDGPDATGESGWRGLGRTAVDWLHHHHLGEVQAAIESGFFESLDGDGRHALGVLPEGLQRMVQTNAMEWLLADGVIEVAGGHGTRTVRTLDLVLGPGGPEMTAAERAHLEALPVSPLRLYVVRGRGEPSGRRSASAGLPGR
jgi:hypothetical protein